MTMHLTLSVVATALTAAPQASYIRESLTYSLLTRSVAHLLQSTAF